jgi:putative addiction module component (TIGR02574 family)
MRRELMAELLELPPAERIELAEALWDSLPDSNLPPLSPEVLDEMDRRLAEHEADPSSAISLEELRAWLRSRRG